MLISSFQILTCCSCALMRTKLMKKLNRNPTAEEDSTQWKFHRRSQLKRREWTGRYWRLVAKEKRANPSTVIRNLLSQASLPFVVVFFYKNQRKKDGSDRRQAQCPISKMLQH